MSPSFLGGQGTEAGCEIPMGWDGLAILFSFWAQSTPKTDSSETSETPETRQR